jgi:hypothetical protein
MADKIDSDKSRGTKPKTRNRTQHDRNTAESQETLYESSLKRLRNTRIVVVALIAFAVVVGTGAATGALTGLWDFVETRILGRSIELRKEYCELLRPLVVELDRTKAAFDRWNQKDLSLESETIRDGNLKARTLLREKGHLVHDSLREDQNQLIFHYDRWLEEYDRVRVKRVSDPNQAFVFVYSFPTESAKRFRDRVAQLESILGGEARCR